jgi:hypothetical protein
VTLALTAKRSYPSARSHPQQKYASGYKSRIVVPFWRFDILGQIYILKNNISCERFSSFFNLHFSKIVHRELGVKQSIFFTLISKVKT